MMGRRVDFKILESEREGKNCRWMRRRLNYYEECNLKISPILSELRLRRGDKKFPVI